MRKTEIEREKESQSQNSKLDPTSRNGLQERKKHPHKETKHTHNSVSDSNFWELNLHALIPAKLQIYTRRQLPYLL